MHPTVMYHPTEAPKGRLFTDEAEFSALGTEWVDTPTKFPVTEAAPEPDADAPKKRGRKPKEPTQ